MPFAAGFEGIGVVAGDANNPENKSSPERRRRCGEGSSGGSVADLLFESGKVFGSGSSNGLGTVDEVSGAICVVVVRDLAPRRELPDTLARLLALTNGALLFSPS
jgi:hypothetical protein